VNAAVPNPREARIFHFKASTYEPKSGIVNLIYQFDEGPVLVETLEFPHAPWPPEATRQAAFENALQLLHGVAGVSYYKAGLSPRLELPRTGVMPALSAFLQELYREGLAELAYRNDVELDGRFTFTTTTTGEDGGSTTRELVLPERALVAMGGGKDSLVGLDLVRQAGLGVLPVCVGGSELIAETVRAAGLPLLRIRRRLAPELAEMNRAGAWNGHVPVTAINSAILLCAAILYGFRYIVFSNERSADEPTLTGPSGRPVNHQYSKSSAFERAFRQVIRDRVSPDIEYFSVLRPFSEVGVVERFAGMPDFHPVFSSCNRNFHLDGPRVEGRWCRDCPKCRFAALALALFLPPEDIIRIQGRDLLDDPSQETGFRALCALGAEKPFECVGEAGESRAIMAELGRRSEWRERAVVQALQADLASVDVPGLPELLNPSGGHCIPPAFQPLLSDLGIPRA
jgi:hypothetical protein